jgi:DNA-directed RNA polymerase specialized sigma24 family protein
MNSTTTADDDNIPSDETLAKEVQGGDMDAFATLYTRCLSRVKGFVFNRRLTVSAADREDLVQEIFTRALEMIADYREGDYDCFRHWLFAKPGCYVLYEDKKKRWLTRQTHDSAVDEFKRSDCLNLICWVDYGCEIPAEVRAALADMRPHWREALELHCMDGLPVGTVAEVMRRNGPCIQNMLTKARRDVRRRCGIDTTPVRRRPRGEVRAEILAAARELFAKHGFDGTGLRDIAAVVGCDSANLIYHFGTKQALFAEATATTCQAVAS